MCKRLLTLLAALLVLSPLLVPDVYAQSGQTLLSWTNATQNEDSSTYNDPAFIDIYRKLGAGAYVRIDSIADPLVLRPTSYTNGSLFNGVYCYRLNHVNSRGTLSQPSNEACKTITQGGNDAPAPGPPSALTVQ